MKAVFCLLAILALAGCADQEEKEDSRLALMKTTNPSPVQLQEKGAKVSKIKKEVEDIEEIYDVAVVKGDHQILVAYKVKHLDRFRMKKIEKKLKKRLEKKYKDENFIVSSDYKIFLEAVRLREKIDAGKMSQKQAGKRLKEILSLKKEMA